MKEPDLTLRTHSLPIHLSTPPAEDAEFITPDEEAEECALFQNIRATVRSKNAQIRALDYQLQHRLTQAAAQADAFLGVKSDLDQKGKDLEKVRECNKELRFEFNKLQKEHNGKETEISELNETVQKLEMEQAEANESVSAGKGFEKTIEILNGELRVWKTRAGSLTTEVELLRKGKAERDVAIDGLKKEKKLWDGEKENLLKERDTIKEEKHTLSGKVREFDAVKQKWEDLVTIWERTMEDQLQEIERLDSNLQRAKDDREHYKSRPHRMEDDKDILEGELNGLKRKLEDINSVIHAPANGREPAAKRPRTPQSAKRDSIPTCPRALASESPDSQRSATMRSPTESRHTLSPANEVCMREPSQQRPYSRRR